MIVKDADPVHDGSKRAQAGVRAEHDMAFYLRRSFGEHRPDILVFHDLRIQHEGEIAQIDHLVIHAHGMFVIESKSVSGMVRITSTGQFVRRFGHDQEKGMSSPVRQARLQADLLRRLLQSNRSTLRAPNRLALGEPGFLSCPMELLVAISDGGIIDGQENAKEVHKADEITEVIERRVKDHRRGASPFCIPFTVKFEDGMYQLSRDEIERLRSFLLASHAPRTESSTASSAAPPVPAAREASGPAPQYICSKCQSLSLEIRHGKYGYYFKCRDCGGNTWIDTRVDASGTKGRIRKDGRRFFLTRPDTGSERLIFTNPPTSE